MPPQPLSGVLFATTMAAYFPTIAARPYMCRAVRGFYYLLLTDNCFMRPPTDTLSRPLRVAIFASGTGTNAESIMRHFDESARVQIALVVCNKTGAPVVGIAERFGIPVVTIQRNNWDDPEYLLELLAAAEIDFIVLAGFLWQVPPALVAAYPNRITNIHPALLPRHGGKGMYGMHVHASVVANADTETGATIHYVNEHYDEGTIIAQERCPVFPNDTPDTVAARVRAIELQLYPATLARLFEV